MTIIDIRGYIKIGGYESRVYKDRGGYESRVYKDRGGMKVGYIKIEGV